MIYCILLFDGYVDLKYITACVSELQRLDMSDKKDKYHLDSQGICPKSLVFAGNI